MAEITPTWTENQPISGFDDATLAAAGDTDGNIDLDALGFDKVEGLLIVTFGGTPDGPVEFEINTSPDSGSNVSDIAKIGPVEIEEGAGLTKKFPFEIEGVAFANFKATNNDSTDAVAVSIIYAGRKWQSV
jgi:hypothetical protein